jgi:O-methyltransferase domain
VSDRAPYSVVWDMFFGAFRTRALGVVADLRIADALASGPRQVEDLAREVSADADALHRILRALASEGIFAEETRGVFRNTDASVLLGGSGVDDFAHLFGTVWHRAAGELAATDSPVFARAFGSDFWTWLAEHPAERGAFDRAMGQSVEWKLDQLERVHWRGDETVVDVGGGNGTVLVEFLRRHPGLRGIVFDLPETVRDEETFGDRCTFVAGDFFDRVPPGDAYVLSTILHDWDDERASTILRTIRASAPEHARLIVMDAVIPPGNDTHAGKWLDLLMLVLFAGRERDREQWQELLGSAGFEPDQVADGLIEARRLPDA